MLLLAQIVHVSVISSSRHVCVRFSLIFTYLPFYFNLSFSVFFHSSVLMHPDLHTDLDNLDSVENTLRHSAKGSLDAYDVTFSLTSQEETQWQEPGAREAAWKLAKSVLKLKEHGRATFFSPSENRCLHQLLNLRNENLLSTPERQLHLISKKDLSDAEMDTLDEIVQSYDSHNRQWRSANA